MKKLYESAQMEIFLFAAKEVIVASGEDTSVFVPSFTLEDNETEVL